MSEPIPAALQELHAYADDALDPEARRRVEQRLAGDAVARQQVEDYVALNRQLRELFEPGLQEPVPAQLRPGRRRWRRPLGALAASLALLAVGTLLGLQLQSHPLSALAAQPSVVREAAMAFAVYAPEVRHPVEVTGDQEPHLVAWLTRRLAGTVRVPRLEPLGFLLVGGRLLSSDDGPGALLMYENGAGRRVTLYLCHNDGGQANTAFRYAEHQNISVFYWYDGPFSYALAGDLGREHLLGLADSVYRQVAI
jgi:anti-sigma factor RsiW